LKTRAEQATRDLEAETRDLQYVHDSLQSKNDKELDAIVARKLAEQRAAENKIAQEAIEWMSTRPDYAPVPENGKAMEEFMASAGLAPCAASYDLAYSVLKSRGQLTLRSGKQLEQQEQTVNPPRTRRSSSVSSTSTQNRSMYDRPKFNEDEAYELPLDELKRRAEMQMNGGMASERSARIATLSNFRLPM
jgi:hypothetical protein